jgi:hypothetical protein
MADKYMQLVLTPAVQQARDKYRVGRSSRPRIAPQQGGAIVPHPGHFLRLDCPQYITPRFTAAEAENHTAPLKARIAELEAQLPARDGRGFGKHR